MHQIPTLKRFSYCLAAFFAESLEARCQVENEDVVGAAPTGAAPTTSEWSTILLPTKVRLILEVLWYYSNWTDKLQQIKGYHIEAENKQMPFRKDIFKCIFFNENV